MLVLLDTYLQREVLVHPPLVALSFPASFSDHISASYATIKLFAFSVISARPFHSSFSISGIVNSGVSWAYHEVALRGAVLSPG